MTPTLDTPRLSLTPLALSDAGEVQKIFPHWEIVRWLSASVPWPYPPDGALTFYRDVALPSVARGESWHWTIRLKEDGHPAIGSIVLVKGEKKNRGFWLGLAWQGKGYMTEACVCVTDFWFDVLKFPLLRVPKAAGNAASRRISEKLGMRLVGTEPRDYVGGRVDSEIWEIAADEWRTWRAVHV